MALSARLQIRQTQSLVITPQLMQAIRLLQMSGVELDRFVASELEQNPLIETDDVPAAGGRPRTRPTIRQANDIDAAPADVFPEQMG